MTHSAAGARKEEREKRKKEKARGKRGKEGERERDGEKSENERKKIRKRIILQFHLRDDKQISDASHKETARRRRECHQL